MFLLLSTFLMFLPPLPLPLSLSPKSVNIPLCEDLKNVNEIKYVKYLVYNRSAIIIKTPIHCLTSNWNIIDYIDKTIITIILIAVNTLLQLTNYTSEKSLRDITVHLGENFRKNNSKRF